MNMPVLSPGLEAWLNTGRCWTSLSENVNKKSWLFGQTSLFSHCEVLRLSAASFTGSFILEGESLVFEPQNVPDQTARDRTFIFCMELWIEIPNRTIEAFFFNFNLEAEKKAENHKFLDPNLTPQNPPNVPISWLLGWNSKFASIVLFRMPI